MIYSIALLDQCDFESIGRKMPKGTGVDATLADGSTVKKHQVRKRKKERDDKENKKPQLKSQEAIATAIEVGSMRETKLAALRMFLEFGSTPEKQQAKRELHSIAYGVQQQPLPATAEAEESDESTEASSDSVE